MKNFHRTLLIIQNQGGAKARFRLGYYRKSDAGIARDTLGFPHLNPKKVFSAALWFLQEQKVSLPSGSGAAFTAKALS